MNIVIAGPIRNCEENLEKNLDHLKSLFGYIYGFLLTPGWNVMVNLWTRYPDGNIHLQSCMGCLWIPFDAFYIFEFGNKIGPTLD